VENARAEAITVRAVRLPDDAAAIDAGVRRAGAYRVRRTGRGFRLDLVRVAPHTKRRTPAAALAGGEPHAAVFVALRDERVVGVLRATCVARNRRLAIAHASVDAGARRRGGAARRRSGSRHRAQTHRPCGPGRRAAFPCAGSTRSLYAPAPRPGWDGPVPGPPGAAGLTARDRVGRGD